MTAPAPRRLIILVQYDPAGGIPPHVRHHLDALRPLAARLVLVSNSALDRDARGWAEARCDRVIARQNIGLDFAGWRDALAQEPLEGIDQAVLTNSSVIGPLHPLPPIFAAMEARGADLWGMVMSRERGLHLQSYFLCAGPRLIRSEAWAGFWAGVEDLPDKARIIARYELGFTRAMQAAGFTTDALIGPGSLADGFRRMRVARLRLPVKLPVPAMLLNRSLHCHERLIRRGMPYLKASLLPGGHDAALYVGAERIRAAASLPVPAALLGG